MSHSLNHIFRLVWSDFHQCWVPVAETCRSVSAKKKTLTAALFISAAAAHAGPSGGQVTEGSANISQQGLQTTIQQNSHNVSINWQNFDISANETVNFQQPNSNSLAVNRINDINGTQIHGQLNANGQVWLVNPNGVMFGESARINVGGLVATTLNPDSDSLNDTTTFSGDSTAVVVNKGQINADQYAALLSHEAINEGIISARLGTAAIAGGNQVALHFDGNRLMNIEVQQSKLDALAANRQLIIAEGGQVLMSAGARDSLLASTVNNDGIIRATGVGQKNGKIVLLGGMEAGTTQVAGTLDVSSDNGDGGFIETSAANINIAQGAQVSAHSTTGKDGQWLIDPEDILIDDGSSGINATTVSNALSTGTNVNICTTGTPSCYNTPNNGAGDAGNITVNNAISWTGDAKLTLSADNNITVNANLTPQDTGIVRFEFPGTLSINSGATVNNGEVVGAIDSSAFVANSGATWGYTSQLQTSLPAFGVHDFSLDNNAQFRRFSGGDGTGGSPFEVVDIYGFQSLKNIDIRGKSFVLQQNIDAASTSNWNGGKGFTPIGQDANNNIFSGSVDGNDYTISNLVINKPGGFDPIGIFSRTTGTASISNLKVTGLSINAFRDHVGGLVGSNAATINNVHVAGDITVTLSTYNIGGLVGENKHTINNSSANVTITATDSENVGGLVGLNQSFGGRSVNITNSYATGNVTGSDKVGGLVGAHLNHTISNSYASGEITGQTRVGGLVGEILSSNTVNNSYATGNITATVEDAGGLVGKFRDTASLELSYSTGTVTSPSRAGALVGSFNQGSIDKAVALTQGSLQLTGSTGGSITDSALVTEQQMTQAQTFTDLGWTIDSNGGGSSAWRIYEDYTKPLLSSFLSNATLNTVSHEYDATTPSLNGLTPLDGSKLFSDANKNVGSYTIYSSQHGYNLTGTSQLEITAKSITVAGSKEYDGNNQIDNSSLEITGLVNGETLQINGSDTTNSQNVASYTLTGFTLSNGSGLTSNYSFSGNTSFDINAKDVTLAGNKTYDGNTNIDSSQLTITGLIGDETLTVTGSGNSNSQNVGNYSVSGFSLADGSALASNYNLIGDASVDIDAKTLTLTGTKTYDGSQQLQAEQLTLVGLVGSETLNLSGQANATAAAANQQGVITSGLTLQNGSGSTANYSLASDANLHQVTIEQREVQLSGRKVYDAAQNIDLATLSVTNLAPGETLTLTGSSQTSSKNVNRYQIATDNIQLSSSNYRLANSDHWFDITARDVEVTATFDIGSAGVAPVVSSLSSTQLLSSDDVTINHLSTQFINNNTQAEVLGLSLSGADSGNYRLISDSAIANIQLAPSETESGRIQQDIQPLSNQLDTAAQSTEQLGQISTDTPELLQLGQLTINEAGVNLPDNLLVNSNLLASPEDE